MNFFDEVFKAIHRQTGAPFHAIDHAQVIKSRLLPGGDRFEGDLDFAVDREGDAVRADVGIVDEQRNVDLERSVSVVENGLRCTDSSRPGRHFGCGRGDRR